MYSSKTFLAIIPARGGSKRLPNKNILDLAGKPLISWSIDAAIKSKYIDKTIVTTDSDEIIEVALKHGAEVPFKRPNHLSSDTAIKEDVIKHTIDYYQNKKQEKFDYLIYLQPTSPLRNERHIDEAIEFMFEKKANAIVSVCELEHPVQWIGLLPDDRDMSNYINGLDIKTRSQDFPIHHRLNGAIFICNSDKFMKYGSVFLKENIFAYVMPQNVSIDIDTDTDFMFAKIILERYR